MRDDTWDRLGDDPAATIEDIDAARAAQVLIPALLEVPCPEHEEQMETLADTDALLRSRLVLLAELAGVPVPDEVLGGHDEDDGPFDDGPSVLRVKVQLMDISPPIWRRLEVPADLTLAQLHDVLQSVFGWNDTHLHAFERPMARGERGRGGWPRRERVPDGRERRLRIGTLLAEPGDVLHYRYDFGDDWDHRIVLEDRLDPADGIAYPRCTAGRRAAPPEDCGGAPGYENLLAAPRRPQPSRTRRLDRVGSGGFRPRRVHHSQGGRRARLGPVGPAPRPSLRSAAIHVETHVAFPGPPAAPNTVIPICRRRE
jgi:hypothetical protein